jgi:glycosyltransferase involved in cell wall biosynthesis
VSPTDVLVVSAANTSGWRIGAEELAASLERAGGEVELVTADPAPKVRTFALTDLVQARTARQAALRGIAAFEPAAIVYCSITAALLWPRPGAISLDSIAAENRPGRHGIWQRPLERRRLAQTPLVLAWSKRALEPLRGPHPHTVVVPVPIEAAAPTPGHRDVAAVTYAGDPVKRRLSHVLREWARARRGDERLIVAGTELPDPPEGVEVCGVLPPDEFRRLLARARVFIAAPQREDYGIAALEALAAGAQLVSAPSPGPYPALDLARELDTRLVSEDLVTAIRTALDDPRPRYAERAGRLLEPFSRTAVDRTVAEAVLPRLLNPR